MIAQKSEEINSRMKFTISNLSHMAHSRRFGYHVGRKGDQVGVGVFPSRSFTFVDPGSNPSQTRAGFGFQFLPDCVGCP